MRNNLHHTPAPWSKTAYADSQGFKIKDQNNNLIAIVKVRETQKPHEAVMNAFLISAAPELLEALKSFLSDIEESTGKDYAMGEWPEVYSIIKKAEG